MEFIPWWLFLTGRLLVECSLTLGIALGLIWILNHFYAIARRDALLMSWFPAMGILLSVERALLGNHLDVVATLEPFIIAGIGPFVIWGTGFLLIKRLLCLQPPVSSLVQFVSSCVVGALIVSIILFLSALAGFWTPTFFFVLSISLLINAGIQAIRCKMRNPRGKGFPFNWDSLGLLPVLVVLVAGFCLAGLPPDESDELRYHLSIPKRYLEYQRYIEIPEQQFSWFPPGMEMLFAFTMAPDFFLSENSNYGWSCGPKMVHYFFLFLVIILLVAWQDEIHSFFMGKIHSRFTAFPWAAGGFLTIPFVPILSSWAFVDLGSALGWLFALYCINQLSQNRGPTDRLFSPFLVLAIFGIAWSMWVKYPSYLWWIILILMIPFTIRGQIRKKLCATVIFACLPLLLVFPHLLNNFLRTGNPVSPLASTWFGSGFTPVQQVFYNWHAGMKGGLNEFWSLSFPLQVLNLLYLPIQNCLQPELFESNPLGVLFLLGIPLIILGMCTRFKERVLLLSGTVLIWLIWGLTYRDPRFALPLWAILFLFMAVGAKRLLMNQSSPAFRWLTVSMIFFFIGISYGQCRETFWRSYTRWPFAVRQQDPDQYLMRLLPAMKTIREVESIRQRNPQLGKMLLIGEEQSYYFDSPVTGSDYFDGPWLHSCAGQSQTLEEMSQKLLMQDIRCVWINREVFERNLFNVFQNLLFSFPDNRGLLETNELITQFPSGVSGDYVYRKIMDVGTHIDTFRRMHAWCILHPGFEEVDLVTSPEKSTPISDLYRAWLNWPELRGIPIDQLPRRGISFLVSKNSMTGVGHDPQ